MFGQTTVTYANYVVADTFGTHGTQTASFLFRILVNAIQQLRISLRDLVSESRMHYHVCAALESAAQGQDVDLYFWAGCELPYMIAGLPKRLLELFVLKYRCQCGTRDYVIALSASTVKCDSCGCQMILEQSPVIAFTKHTNQIAYSLYGAYYCLNGLFTSYNYSVLVDFRKLEAGQKDVFLLEAMQGSKVQNKNKGKIGYLTFLQPGRLKDYLIGNEHSVRAYIGNISNVCWFNQAYMSNRQLIALDLPAKMEEIQIATLEQPISNTRVLQRPVYYPQQPSFVTYTWVIYVVLGVLFVLLFILMILLSIMIGRQNKTMRVKSIYAKGVSFASLPYVQSARDIYPYLDSFSTVQNNAKQTTYVSKHSLYMGATQIDSAYFEKLAFDNASIQYMNAVLQPNSSSTVIVKNLMCEKLSAGQANIGTAKMSGAVTFLSSVSLNVSSGNVGNATVSTFTTGSVNASGDIACYYFTSSTLTGKEVYAYLAVVTSQLQAVAAQCPTVSTVTFIPSNITFQGDIYVYTLEVNGSTININSVLSSPDFISWNYADIVFNGALTVANLSCPNIEATTSVSGGSAAFSDLKLTGNFTVSGDLRLKKLTVTQTSNTSQFSTAALTAQVVNINNSMSLGSYGDIQPFSATFRPALSQIGQFSVNSLDFYAPATATVNSANVTVSGACRIGTINGDSATGIITAQQVITPSLSAVQCTLQSVQSTILSFYSVNVGEVAAASFKLDGTEFVKASGQSVAIDVFMLRSYRMCDANGEIELKY